MNTHSLRRLIVLLSFLLLHVATWAAPALVSVLTLNGAVTPASADYLVRGIERAAKENAQLVVVMIDTPGGLDTSMRAIIKSILASPVPVAVFVAPSGARAASAGTYILYASHIAAMAPGTNLGAATPVRIGAPSPTSAGKKDEPEANDAMTHKQVNDASAYIRGLAQMRGRNIEWAEKAVREAVSLPSSEAAKLHVVDYVARDLPDLLKILDGKTIDVQGKKITLQTAGAVIVRYEPDWRVRLLAVITDPSIALILLAIGAYGLLFEFMSPGMTLPGVLGGICLLLALYALQLLPVNYAGLALIVLGISFMVGEAFLPTFGALGIGGVIAFIFGAVILIDTETPGYGIPAGVIATVAIASFLLIAAMAGIAAKTRRRRVVIGDNELVGKTGEVQQDTSWARVHGETWRIVSKVSLRPEQKVKILGRDGLVLDVIPLNNLGEGE